MIRVPNWSRSKNELNKVITVAKTDTAANSGMRNCGSVKADVMVSIITIT